MCRYSKWCSTVQNVTIASSSLGEAECTIGEVSPHLARFTVA